MSSLFRSISLVHSGALSTSTEDYARVPITDRQTGNTTIGGTETGTDGTVTTTTTIGVDIETETEKADTVIGMEARLRYLCTGVTSVSLHSTGTDTSI
jgi:hypothetical protein